MAVRLRTLLPDSVVSLVLDVDRAWKGVGVVPMAEQLLTNRCDKLRNLKHTYFLGFIQESDENMIKSICVAEGIEFCMDLGNRCWN